jgi:hypothetical protein
MGQPSKINPQFGGIILYEFVMIYVVKRNFSKNEPFFTDNQYIFKTQQLITLD